MALRNVAKHSKIACSRMIWVVWDAVWDKGSLLQRNDAGVTLQGCVIDLQEVTFPTADLIYAQDAPVFGFGLFCFFGSMWNLSLLVRDRTHTPCIGSLES